MNIYRTINDHVLTEACSVGRPRYVYFPPLSLIYIKSINTYLKVQSIDNLRKDKVINDKKLINLN